MDKFTHFEIRRDKRKHKDCKKGVYKEGIEYYKEHWPHNTCEGDLTYHDVGRRWQGCDGTDHLCHFDYDEAEWDIGCDNCVALWLGENSEK